MRTASKQNPIIRLYLNLLEERKLLFFAFFSSVINKILDLAPPVIIGLAVDIIVKENNSWIAGFGIKEVPSQLVFLAFVSGIVWSSESFFEYLYSSEHLKFSRAQIEFMKVNPLRLSVHKGSTFISSTKCFEV